MDKGKLHPHEKASPPPPPPLRSPYLEKLSYISASTFKEISFLGRNLRNFERLKEFFKEFKEIWVKYKEIYWNSKKFIEIQRKSPFLHS